VRARLLISYHYAKRWDLDAMIADNTNPGETPDLWADSGGFSAMTVGAEITVEEYADWLLANPGRFSAACCLDVIGDPVGTMVNQHRLEDLGVDVLPVYHMRANRWDVFDEICDNYAHACLGGMAGTGTPPQAIVRFLVHALRRCRDRGSACVFHVLGMTSYTTLANLPIYSADCSTWAAAHRWGYYELFDQASGRLRQVWMGRKGGPSHLGENAALLRAHGVEPRALVVDPPWKIRTAIAAVAYAKRERWMRQRVGPIVRADQPDAEPGLRLYLSVAQPDLAADLLASLRVIDDLDNIPMMWTQEDARAVAS
jgi:hypothetical protein